MQLEFPGPAKRCDDETVVQGWNDCPAPVLWTEWWVDGLLVRMHIFAYVPGAEDTVTGTEPLYAWVRFRVHDMCEGLPLPDECTVAFTISAPCIKARMDLRNNFIYNEDVAAYPRILSADHYDTSQGFRLVECDGKIRLGLPAGQDCESAFEPGGSDGTQSKAWIKMPARKNAQVDMLLPMLPTDPTQFEEQLAVGFDNALAAANAYWARTPDTAARFDCPEEHVNHVVANCLKFAEVVAERDPATGICSVLSGSLAYSYLWATPGSMVYVTLDTTGYHDVAEKYLRVFRERQGSRRPPGSSYTQHPGCLSSPDSLSRIDWLTDHGALLWAISEHALLGGDRVPSGDWIPTIVKACDFIKDSRAARGHGGVEGLMPPAHASDLKTEIQAVWTDGWCYKGLATAVKVLRKMSHPRSTEFGLEAQDYKETFLRAFREKAADTPKWTDRGGVEHFFCPVSMSLERPEEIRHAFYLDAGPVFLVFAGLMEADDELMQSLLLWFREGPQVEHYRPDGNCWQVPCLVHEMSSCEPCYSWNVFHSWQIADRPRFLEGMYSQFAGGCSQQTGTICETRGGVTGTCPWLPAVYLARLAVVDDAIADGELHLLRLMPLS